MKIRSLTCFFNPNIVSANKDLSALNQLVNKFRIACINEGLTLQTSRLSSPSFASLWPDATDKSLIKKATELESKALNSGFEYLSLGPAMIENLKSYQTIPALLSETKNTFFSGFIANSDHGVNIAAIEASSNVIFQSATIEPDGFANLRFSALAFVEPFGPFFPGSFNLLDQPLSISIAVEAADEVVNSFQSAGNISEAREILLSRLENQAKKITAILDDLLKGTNIIFKGFDFSVAPFPKDECSLGNALEILGVPALGQHGSLAAASILADTLDRGNWLRVGYNGLMLPLLEDSILAQRSIDNTLSVKDLLMFSAVCGTGLDTIPLAGDVPLESIKALLLDVAALSCRLQKPLTARLMPVPGKKAGEMTSFDFDFFANGRILNLEAQPLKRFLGSTNEHFNLQTRQYYKSKSEHQSYDSTSQVTN